MRRIAEGRVSILLGALIVLKFGLLLIDGKPSVFLGDSASYLYTALHNYIPHDRSFIYGLLLRPLVIWPHSLRVLLFAQAAMSAISAWLIAFILVSVFSIRFRWAALLSFLCAVEPLQLLSERYIMTDTPGLFLFAVLVAVSLAFFRRSTQTRFACALLVGVALIGIRMSYLPIVLLNSVLLPLVWFLRHRGSGAWALLLLWLGAGQLMLYGYRCFVAYESDMAKPEYLYADGFLLVSQVSPILTLSDFPPDAPGQRILAEVGVPLGDPLYREAQRYYSNGLTSALLREIPDEFKANQMAKKIAWHAILAHPVALTRLAFTTWTQFFDMPLFKRSIVYDEGGLKTGDENFRVGIIKALGTDFGAQSSTGPVWRWHRAAIPWYWFLIVAPFVMPAVLLWAWRVWRRVDAAALIQVYLTLLFAEAIVMSTHPEPRYLMPIAWLVLLSFGSTAQLISCHFHKRAALQRTFRDLQVVQTHMVESP